MMKLNKRMLLLFVVEICLILFCLIGLLRDEYVGKELSYTVSGLDTDRLENWEMEYSSEREAGTVVMKLDYGILEKGVYKIEVDYSTDETQRLWVETDNYSIPEKSIGTLLDYRKNSTIYFFRNEIPAENFCIYFEYEGGETFVINNVKLFKSKRGYIRTILELIAFFSIVEAFVYLLSKDRKKLNKLMIVVGIGVASSMPLFFKGINIGHDFTYHYTRIEGIYRELMAGNFPVYHQSIWLNGYGSPVSLYYGDWMLYLPAVLRLCGYSFVEAYKVFVFVVNIITAVFSIISFKRIFNNKRLALVLGLVYTIAPYRMIDIYVRCAVGEYCALTFIPLVIAGYYGVMTIEKSGKEKNNLIDIIKNRDILMLGLGMTGLVTSHMLSAEITVFLLIICTLVGIKKISIRKIQYFSASVLIFIGTSMFFIVPFMDAYFHNDLEINHIVAANNYIQGCGAQIGELFAFTKDIFGEGQSYNYGLDRMRLSLGIIPTVSIMASIILIIKHKANSRLKLFTALAFITLFMSTDIFPWNKLVYYTTVGKVLATVQFPWRFLTYSTAFSIIVLGDVIIAIMLLGEDGLGFNIELEKILYLIVLVVSFFELILFQSMYGKGYEPLYNEGEMLDTRSSVEYLRYGTDPYGFVYNLTGENVSLQLLDRNGSTIVVQCKTAESGGNIVFPMQNVIGFEATDDKGNRYPIVDGPNKEVEIDLPSNYEGVITVKYVPKWYWKLSFNISVISVIMIMLIQKRKYIK